MPPDPDPPPVPDPFPHPDPDPLPPPRPPQPGDPVPEDQGFALTDPRHLPGDIESVLPPTEPL